MSKGWIKLHRQFLEWQWYEDSNCVRVFLHCLLKANHKDKKYKDIVINRGSFVTGIVKLSSELGLSVQQIRTALVKLEKTGEIRRKATNKGTYISVCKYNTYQPENIENNKPTTNQQQTNNKLLTTTKNDKNVKNEKNVYYIPTLSDVQEYFKHSNKIQSSHVELEAENFINHYESLDWKRNGKKIKNWKLQASTWANNYLKFNPVVRNIHDNPFD